MAQVALSQSVKTRVPGEWKETLVAIADQENLDLSDIVRRAISEFIRRKRRNKPAYRVEGVAR